ncbi:inner membrane protein YbjM [Rouxiella chamberiensis]|uniref:inner membrane protein YbjM n=1 Tax=Rouxiella chamberiensis TaxID=1513468 RepID=UPI0030C688CD
MDDHQLWREGVKKYFSLLCGALQAILFIIVFISLKGHVISVNRIIPQGDLCMLLYLVPGMAACFVGRGEHFVALFISALISVPLCLIIRHYFLLEIRSYWQELAYLVSAVFWSMLGAMFVILYRVMGRIRSS